MKKIITVVLAVASLTLLTGCGASEPDGTFIFTDPYVETTPKLAEPA